jgi:hypothetical protein
MPILNENVLWEIEIISNTGSWPPIIEYNHYSIDPSMDTVLNGFLYRNYDGHWLREDTNSGKVFEASNQFGTEDVVIDFTLSIGDSIYDPHWSHFDSVFLHLQAIDTLLIGGAVRRVFSFGRPSEPPSACDLRWIEGIGSTESGPLGEFPGDCWHSSYKLTCFRYIDSFPSSIYGSFCTPVGSKSEEIDEANLIYPNPFTESFRILDIPNASMITVFNSSGALIYQKKTSSASLEVDLKEFPSGVYLLRVDSEESSIAKRLIKSEG